jgi:ubiquinone/menaquinone biosynthesis C-methylase UbiE
VIDAMHRYAYALIEEYARPSDRLLEIGFGEGYGAEIVQPWISEYVGLEVDAQAVLHAAKRHASPGLSFLQYDGVTLPFDDGTFELVISFQVIEHVVDPPRLLKEACRVLRGTGTALIVTPNRNHRVADGERPFNRYHVREFNSGELEALMRTAFEKVTVFGIQGSPVMNEIEKKRVARARKLARFDPLGLRYVLPESFDTWLRTALRRGSAPRDETMPSQVDVEHMYHSRVGVEESLDLLAVARV